MAFVGLMLGGLIGSISFLIALLVLDLGLQSAVGLYFSTGFGSALLVIGFALLPGRRNPDEIKVT